MATATDRQMEFYDAIVAYMKEHHRAPTVRELCGLLGVTINAVYLTLRVLRSKGYIELENTTARGIRLKGHVACPHCGGLGTVPDPEKKTGSA